MYEVQKYNIPITAPIFYNSVKINENIKKIGSVAKTKAAEIEDKNIIK